MLLALRWATVSTDDLDPISIRVVDKGNVLLTAEISINLFRKHLSLPHPSIHIFPLDWCGITAAFAASEPASHSLRIKYPPPPPSPPGRKRTSFTHSHPALLGPLFELDAELIKSLASSLEVVHADTDVAETSSRLLVTGSVALEVGIILYT